MAGLFNKCTLKLCFNYYSYVNFKPLLILVLFNTISILYQFVETMFKMLITWLRHYTTHLMRVIYMISIKKIILASFTIYTYILLRF